MSRAGDAAGLSRLLAFYFIKVWVRWAQLAGPLSFEYSDSFTWSFNYCLITVLEGLSILWVTHPWVLTEPGGWNRPFLCANHPSPWAGRVAHAEIR